MGLAEAGGDDAVGGRRAREVGQWPLWYKWSGDGTILVEKHKEARAATHSWAP